MPKYPGAESSRRETGGYRSAESATQNPLAIRIASTVLKLHVGAE